MSTSGITVLKCIAYRDNYEDIEYFVTDVNYKPGQHKKTEGGSSQRNFSKKSPLKKKTRQRKNRKTKKEYKYIQ